MNHSISDTINEFGGPSILDADEKENKLLFGSIAHVDDSLSVGFGSSQIPDRFFFPPNDSLFASETLSTIEPTNTVNSNILASLSSNLSTIPRINDITEFLKNSRVQPSRNIIKNSLDDIVIIGNKKAISWPSLKIGASFIQYCTLKHRYNGSQTIILKFKHTTGPENSFMFVYKNQCNSVLTLDFVPDKVIRLGVLFLPLEIGKAVSSIEVYQEKENRVERDNCLKLLDLYGYGGEIIFRPNLLINPFQKSPEIILYIGKKFSFELFNFGDTKMFFLLDLPQDNFIDINVLPKSGCIRPKSSIEILVNNCNSDDDFYHKFGTTAESLIKISQLNIIYGVLSDILRINRLYKDYNSSHRELFMPNIKELNLISNEMESSNSDINFINDLPENFNILYEHGIKRLTIDIRAIRCSNN